MVSILTTGRQPKSIDLFQDYEEVADFPRLTLEVRCAAYSANGKYLAYTQPTCVVVVNTQEELASNKLAATIEVKDALELQLSPDGKYITLWTKPVLLNKESGVWSDNVLLYDIEAQKMITLWSNKSQGGWQPQFTHDGKTMAKNYNNKEIHFYDVNPELDIKKPTCKYHVQDKNATFLNFKLSPGLNPSVAVFIPEKGGNPAEVFIYNIPNFNQPVCSKTFFKAEKCQLVWNSLGTALLALASTDHDTSNKSYYGETNLYLLGIAGSYERINLKREGPIHDITWSPSAREFAVSYGYMPSETTFFDARGNSIYSLPTAPRNTILYSPHGRFVLVAGFGNLQGKVDVYDRQDKFSKVCTFEADNTSVCEWSPCGRFILTATTSPRLRVDNGLKVWHASGKLIYFKEYPELLSVSWRPQSINKFPALRQLEDCPEPKESAKLFLAKKAAVGGDNVVKKAGAYRPPHARVAGVAAPATTLYQKEMQRNVASEPYVPGMSRKVIPGFAPVPAKNKKKDVKKPENGVSASIPGYAPAIPGYAPSVPAIAPAAPNGAPLSGGAVSLEEKKIRSLLKKLRAIETLKVKRAQGESLEDTQVSKINKEDELRRELTKLGWSVSLQ